MGSIELQPMLEHLEWADATVLTSVLASPNCAADRRLRELLVHIHAVEWAYLQLWRNEPPSVPAVEDFADLGAVVQWARRYHQQRSEFTATLTEADLERHIQFPWAEHLAERFGLVPPTTVRQSMLQIALHSAYHRGQVNARLRELGGDPPLVDFVAWIWAGAPAPPWPQLEV